MRVLVMTIDDIRVAKTIESLKVIATREGAIAALVAAAPKRFQSPAQPSHKECK